MGSAEDEGRPHDDWPGVRKIQSQTNDPQSFRIQSETSLIAPTGFGRVPPLAVALSFDIYDNLPVYRPGITRADLRSIVATERLECTYAGMRASNAANMRLLRSLAPEKVDYVTSLSINLGQLDFARVVSVKGVAERQDLFDTALADVFLYGADTGSMAPGPPDIVQCQELWLGKARQRLNAMAERCGYEPMIDDKAAGTYGLQIYARLGSIVHVHDSGVVEFVDAKKGQQIGEILKGKPMRAGFDRVARIRRGYAYAMLELKSGIKLLAGTTHLSPLHNYAHLRDSQFTAMARIHADLAKNADAASLGGDLNTVDRITRKNGGSLDNQVAGLDSLSGFHEKLGAVDAYVVAGRPDDHTTMSPDLKQFSNADWDMSGTRIDYQYFTTAPSALAACVSYGTVLGESHLTSRNRLMPISDHKGVQSTQAIARREPT